MNRNSRNRLNNKVSFKLFSFLETRKKIWYIYTVEYYSAIKRNEIGSFVETWMDLETVIQSEISQKEKKQMSYINAYMWNLERWYR